MLFPSSIPPPVVIERANEIWKRRGIRPKQHLSEQRPGAVTLMERRAHSDRCEALPTALPDDMGKQSSTFCTVRLTHKLTTNVKRSYDRGN
jgi:UV DNA damage repair endonuclease